MLEKFVVSKMTPIPSKDRKSNRLRFTYRSKKGPFDVRIDRGIGSSWQPRIRVWVDGVLFHDADAKPDDFDHWETIVRALDHHRSSEVDHVREVFRDAIGY